MFQTFYHNTTRNCVVAFGDLFNNIYIVRYNANGSENKRIKVPIDYSPKQKWYRAVKEVDQRGILVKQTSIILPRISFEIINLVPDLQRKSQIPQQLFNMVGSVTKQSFSPTPYKYSFELNVIVENSSDGFQIMEQILPFFNPTLTISVNSLPDIGYAEDLSLTLNNVIKNDEYSGDFETLRLQTYTISFDMRVNLYGPITDAKLIKKVLTHLHVVKSGGEEISTEDQAISPIRTIIETEPDPVDALPTDDYGFSITITNPEGNVIFNPETLLYEEI